MVPAEPFSANELFRVLEGVAGTESVGRPLPMLKGGLLCGRAGGGMLLVTARSRAGRGASEPELPSAGVPLGVPGPVPDEEEGVLL